MEQDTKRGDPDGWIRIHISDQSSKDWVIFGGLLLKIY